MLSPHNACPTRLLVQPSCCASFVQDLQLLRTTVPGVVTMSRGGVITLPTPITVGPLLGIVFMSKKLSANTYKVMALLHKLFFFFFLHN